MIKIFQIIEIIVAVLLTAAILIQSRGAGLGGVFGGEGGVYRTKRGAEKIIFNATIILAVIFFGVAMANVFLAK